MPHCLLNINNKTGLLCFFLNELVIYEAAVRQMPLGEPLTVLLSNSRNATPENCRLNNYPRFVCNCLLNPETHHHYIVYLVVRAFPFYETFGQEFALGIERKLVNR